MHLADITALRAVPAAGLLVALTRRCPLACAHCSTDSAMDSQEHPSEPFRTLVASFTADARPEVMVLSGGEPLLRPELVAELATTARVSGTRTCLLSGMYFARQGTAIPAALRRAIGTVDHFAASLDAHHEREVGRARVFAMMRQIADLVPATSFQVTGLGDDDPYVAELVAAIRHESLDRIPVLVSRIQPTGRGRRLVRSPSKATCAEGPMPCPFAAWPLVDYDGTVYACSRQSLSANLHPAHLMLGHAARDPWDALRHRTLGDPVLRTIRVLGPVEVRERFGTPDGKALGVCATCAAMADDPGLAGAAADWLNSPVGSATEMLARPMVEAADARRFASRWGSSHFAGLVGLGRDGAA